MSENFVTKIHLFVVLFFLRKKVYVQCFLQLMIVEITFPVFFTSVASMDLNFNPGHNFSDVVCNFMFLLLQRFMLFSTILISMHSTFKHF